MHTVETLRSFNRFYTRVLGLFKPKLMGGSHTLIEARVLYEVWRRPGISSADLARLLDVDPGQLSRTVKRLAGRGLVHKPEKHAGRRAIPLDLTQEGERVMRGLDELSATQAAGLLGHLDAGRRRRLAAALAEVRELLGAAGGPPPEVVLRGARPGDLGRIVQRHGELYAASHGFDTDFEKYVILGMADWLRAGSPRSGLWVAEAGGVFLGGVAVVDAEPGRAQLRWLIVEPHARGRGVGRLLVERAVAFAREAGYAELFLWTLSSLAPAKALYASAGFELMRTTPGTMGGESCVEERWALDLAAR